MNKAQAEPGLAKQVIVYDDDTYSVAEVDTVALIPKRLRWIANGRTVLNNKGNPVRKYDPYFSVRPQYEDAAELVETGVSPVLFYDAVGRLVKTEYPDKTFSRVEFDAWQRRHYDQNDTVKDSQWYSDRINNNIGAELIAEGKDPAKEKAAAQQAGEHHDTPNAIYLDALGHAILSISNNGKDTSGKDKLYTQTIELDIESNARKVVDARGNTVMEYRFDILGHRVYQTGMDSGERWLLNDVLSSPLRRWDGRNFVHSFTYDPLHRPLEKKVQNGDDPNNLLNNVYEKVTYGENQPDDKERNLRGQVHQRYDTAGKEEFIRYNAQGSLLSSIRRYASDYKDIVDWSGSNPDLKLEAETHLISTEYDAMARITAAISADGSVTAPTYNEANLLETVGVTQPTAPMEKLVENIDYNAKGQRTHIRYRNGVVTAYGYDDVNFRLIHLQTRKDNGDLLQDLYYTYDPVGNITHVEDKSIPVVFFNNQKIEALSLYTYDPLYRLTEAEGREHAGQAINFGTNDNWQDLPFLQQYSALDPIVWRNYVQSYEYDPVGNISQVTQQATGGNWTRHYSYEVNNNRLASTTVGANTYTYPHHATHGFMQSLSHLTVMEYNFKDELTAVSQQSVTSGIPETTYYVYDSTGQRVRKITENSAADGATPTKKSERLYIASVEIYRELSGANSGLERTSLHIMDDARRIGMIDTRNDVNDGTATRTIRYQLTNHLDTASLEVDDNADVINYEEYHPFGTTAYQAVSSDIIVAVKRYRYTGKERDEESGLYYYGARYYLCWLGRWMKPDPTGLRNGLNMYSYVNNKVISFRDPNGFWEYPSWETVAVVTAVVVVGTVVTVATAGAAGPVVAGAVASVGLSGTAATVATGVGVGVVSGVVGGAAAGAAGEGTRQAVHGETLDVGRIASEAGHGALVGGAVGGAVGGVVPLVAAGASAAASTTAGAAVVSTARSGAASIASSTVGRAVTTGVQRAASSTAGQVAAAPVKAVTSGLQRVHAAGEAVGTRAAAQIPGRGGEAARAALSTEVSSASSVVNESIPTKTLRGIDDVPIIRGTGVDLEAADQLKHFAPGQGFSFSMDPKPDSLKWVAIATHDEGTPAVSRLASGATHRATPRSATHRTGAEELSGLGPGSLEALEKGYFGGAVIMGEAESVTLTFGSGALNTKLPGSRGMDGRIAPLAYEEMMIKMFRDMGFKVNP
jgi:RHS repeat-associated protein